MAYDVCSGHEHQVMHPAAKAVKLKSKVLPVGGLVRMAMTKVLIRGKYTYYELLPCVVTRLPP
jgi:hypothetical protein